VTVDPPTDLELTSNDGWLVLSFPPVEDSAGYQFQAAQKIDGVLGAWTYVNSYFENGMFGDSSWEYAVLNGQDYCFRANTVVQASGGYYTSDYSEMVCGQGAPNATFSTLITDGKADLTSVGAYVAPLDGVASGAAITDFLTDKGTPILFGNIYGGALAYQNPITKNIVLDDAYENLPSEFIAALLAHEGLHAIWDQDWASETYAYGLPPNDWVPPADWIGPRRSSNSLYQEYSAFLSALQAWDSIWPGVDYGSLDQKGQNLYDQQDYLYNWLVDGEGQVIPFSDPDVQTTLISTYGYNNLFDY
jgi:hypothetical protein